MKKEDLLALGLSEEQSSQVMTALDGDYVTKARFNEVNEAKNSLEAQIKERDQDINSLKAAAGSNQELQQKYAELQNKYKADTEALNQKLATVRLDSALDKAILAAKGRNPKAIKALLDIEHIKLKEDGTLDGLDLEALKKSDGYLFEQEASRTEGLGYQASALATSQEICQEQFENALMGR